ncbi:hypothetical protein phytr_3570 [Candidatus Phycorickettsia trachydisci]|uniref:DUF748 domain-containing protein n=1 Tax=Candidatus Phycorickettsia trachydisci TaxID=2115978 RepID=A0A2P1P7R2_9RICK|nr:hypothetical protein [Candidatus Phycorickettsia trachydisci]AVP87309.1 hypothetical protein phytr_3570 [Candidatus Phycorickettsia trachydisci]
MKKAARYSLISLILFSLYFLSWYVLSWMLCKELGRYSSELQVRLMSTDVTYSFQKAVPYGFPFKIGAKIIGLHEDAKAYHTSHDGLVTVGYDLIRQGVFFENTGQSIARVKPFSSGFGSIVNVSSSYLVKLGLPRIFYQLLIKQTSAFELINFIDRIQFVSKDSKIYDLSNEELIFDHDFIKLSFNWDKSKYYHSLDEMLKDIPDNYSANMELAIGDVIPNRAVIAPISLVYLILPPIDNVKINFAANLSTNKENPTFADLLNNFKLDVQTLEIDGKDASGKIKFLTNVQRVERNEDSSFDLEMDLSFKNLHNLMKYLEFINKKSPELEILKNKDLIQILQQPYDIKTSISGRYKLSPKINKISLDNFDFMLDGVGFNLKADTALSDARQWHFDGSLLLLKPDSVFRKMVNIAAIYTKEDVGARERRINDSVRLLKAISNHPTSESRDIAIDFSLSNNINSSRIGTIPLKFFKNIDTFKQFFNQGDNK